ncbi:hypothetical protein SAMN05192558_105334 [Actinokineospora alba]|uniref:Uncharacterized protein n=1 Tax=Actinokineospora alba TaxID=504798 RepID=A0A1H0NGQ9_9PSEU|nr:hypothetical protein [Actinokineospora alba]TDP68704.1 hypothetical protein C8E96_4269 [Actinokineospora alba]SDH84886.1 hypothetical protein SAMN05421871_102384 [Actinokineospora alba]SDO91510.1 hypothetical protein SAMN05192558_105334 [Actinokineospora alba]
MRRYLLMSCVVASCALSGVRPATAAPQPPAITVATASDNVAHPGSATEWWYVSVIDPATGATFIAQQFTAPLPVTNSFFYAESGAKAHMTSSTTQPVTTSAPSVCSNAMCLSYDAMRRAYHLVYAANGVTADLWLDTIRPGITTKKPLAYDDQEMFWTVPVATSTVSGWAWPVGAPAPISVDGWRGYHDHDWGSFDLGDQRYTGWEWGISHHPDGSAQLMGGVIGGDGRWQGVMAKVTPTATTFCQSDSSVDPTALTLSAYSTHHGFDYPETVRTKCSDGTPAAGPFTFAATDPYLVNEIVFAFTESVGHTVPGSVALIEHFRTASHSGT